MKPAEDAKNQACDLCGLPLRFGVVTADIDGQRLRFCCAGCRQVYRMLMEAADSPDPANFKETEIYRRCVDAGIIPASLSDLESRSRQNKPSGKASKSEISSSPDSGFSSENHLSLDLRVEGMWCPACAWVIEETLRKTRGIGHVDCQFSRDRLRLKYDPVKTAPRHIIDRIEKLGYRAAAPGDGPFRKASRDALVRLAISAFLTMNVMMLSFALYSGFFTDLSAGAVEKISWPIVILSAVVFFYGGGPIHRKAIAGLRAAAPGMEVLISIGATAAFGYSVYNWVNGSIHLYFDTASMLITLVLVGKAVEQWTKDRVQAQLGSFFDRLPAKVRLCTDDFPRGRYVDASVLQKGDTFRVTADETLAADGRVTKGAATVDESALTGEARPIEKQAGDTVSSGTRVISGDMRVRATAVGENAMVGQLTAIMEKALSDKTAMEGAADRALRYFVPAIVLLAAATGSICLLAGFGVRESLIRAITVLVISCPCALGVAIPLARVAGISLAAKIGVLVHDFSAFEGIRKMGAYVFDKTGTLTRGRWEFLDVVPADGRHESKIWSMAAGIEAFSGHWVGQAIAFSAEQRGIVPAAPADATEYDNGIAGTIDGVWVKIGSARFVADVLGNIENRIDNSGVSEETAVSAVYMTIEDALAAVFYFGDRVRQSSAAVIAALKEKGKAVAMISGDGRRTTAQLGRMLGIDDCHGGMRPEEKAAFVQNLKQDGRRVVMVGDGVNDVPALATADLGIAVHGGHQIGNEASAVTLMGNDPEQILDFETLAARVAKTIRQNLVFTFAYNAVAIPVAMSGLLNPLVAVTAMLLSSLSVTGNTLQLSVRGVPAHSQEERPAQFPVTKLTKETA